MIILIKKILGKTLLLMIILITCILGYSSLQNHSQYAFNPSKEEHRTHYRIEATLDEGTNRLHIREWIRFVNDSNRILDSIYLEVGSKDFQVEGILVNEQAVNYKIIKRNPTRMKLYVQRPLLKGVTTFVEVEGYMDILFDEAESSFDGSGYYLTGWYPMLGHYGEMGWSLDDAREVVTDLDKENDYDIIFRNSKSILPVFEGKVIDQGRGLKYRRYHIRTTKGGEVRAVMIK